MAKKKAKKNEKEAAGGALEPSLSKGKVRSVTLVDNDHENIKKSSESLSKRRKSKSRSGILEPRISEIPTKGSQLLDWVRKRTSYLSDDEGESSEEEEVQETTKEKKKKSHQAATEEKEEKKPKATAAAPKKGKKAKVEPEEKIIKLPRPAGLEDEVTLLIKERKEIKRLAEEKARLESEPSIHSVEEIPVKGGSKKGKVKGKTASVEQIKMEKDRTAKAADLQKKLEEDEKEALQKQQNTQQKEQMKRLDGFKSTLEVIKGIEDHCKKLQRKMSKENYWRLYVNCGNLPIVNHISDMTMYLQSWSNEMIDTTPKDASARTKDVLKLLNVLDHFIENDPPKLQSRLENYKWLRTSFREQLREMMEHMTYKLMRDVDKNMNHVNLYIGDYNFKDENFTICLWLKFKMPTPLFNPRKAAPPPISLEIKDLKMSLEFPPSITGEGMFVRVMYLIYDHLSDTSKGSLKPPKPEYYSYKLNTVMEKEWRVMRKYRVVGRYRAQYEQELQKHENNLQEKANYRPFSMNPPPPDLPPLSKFQPPEIDENGEIPEVPPTKLDPTPEEYAETLEECQYAEMRQHLLYLPMEHEINLRKYMILGGIHMLNLFYQPPQPQHLVTMILSVATFVLPKCLTEVPFYEEFKTMPTTGEQKTPEELEAALKLQEEGFGKLITMTITFPTHVMYLEPPVVCMWEEEHKRWSTKDIQDVKHNEEKGTVNFRTGRFGIFGLATFRYGNLPYQTWDIRPDEDNNIIFQLTAAVLLFEFKIKDSLVTVTQFQNGPNNALHDIVSKSFSINKLAKVNEES